MDQFDCVVVGGGMVGAASALTLAELGLTVAVIEKHQPKAFEPSQPFDLRVSAISLASQHLLEQTQAWQQIADGRICPYKRLGVWEQEQAYTEFSSQEISQPYLGHIIENRLIQLSLWQQIAKHSNITLKCPESLISLEQSTNAVSLTLSAEKISAKLLVAADGANSQVRQLAGIGVTGWEYGQDAMLINVETEASQQDITWQQFQPTGPVAMLPMVGNYASLVWYHQKAEIARLAKLSNQQLQEEISQHFPTKLGNVRVIDKGAFPLTRRHANQYQQGRILLLGDAAHTINPLAGQGVNLGFKDVKALQTVIAKAIGEGKQWHDPDVLASYEKMRRPDNLMMMTTMDSFYAAFSNQNPVLKAIRNIGLSVVNKVPTLKAKALAYACGV
ncbi:FAD-dependent oxidoreductase [Thalassotalea sp. 1_MG-2023]|uniref:FAD-dependent oxidoreductase n=1 Tax=Thalassotalea sp. 1_MG-2023 TaxID=3062680 RepID=UPI0026E24D0D|nr:FAD-dependent oxidoreductase [Thalassotalea sp. 1_MG-2023]MDO6428927.1 FAD-dependent oxidoreductase [Thalassotalea sp. 1_MG-2023]